MFRGSEIEGNFETETSPLLAWRLEQLVEAGYGFADAVEVALNLDVDLRVARELLERGCPSETALRILR